MFKVTIKRNKTSRLVDVSFKGMTQGKALALCHALAVYSEKSSVAEDLRVTLHNQIQPQGTGDDDQDLLEALQPE